MDSAAEPCIVRRQASFKHSAYGYIFCFFRVNSPENTVVIQLNSDLSLRQARRNLSRSSSTLQTNKYSIFTRPHRRNKPSRTVTLLSFRAVSKNLLKDQKRLEIIERTFQGELTIVPVKPKVWSISRRANLID